MSARPGVLRTPSGLETRAPSDRSSAAQSGVVRAVGRYGCRAGAECLTRERRIAAGAFDGDAPTLAVDTRGNEEEAHPPRDSPQAGDQRSREDPKPRREEDRRPRRPSRRARLPRRSRPRSAARMYRSSASGLRRGTVALERIPRRAIFIDVENTSSEDDLFEVLEALHIDRGAQPTELTAVGNWRAIGQRLARHLATHRRAVGAQRARPPACATGAICGSPSPPAAGSVQAQPGDVLEIVVQRPRLRRGRRCGRGARRGLPPPAAQARLAGRRQRCGRRRGAERRPAIARRSPSPRTRHRERAGRAGRPAPRPAPASTPRHVAAPAARTAQPKPAHRAPSHPPLHDEAHGATRDQIVSVIGRLSGSDPTRWINLDVLEKALKSEGFARPPGSPRLVTRLRMFKDVEVDSHGRARLVAALESARRTGAGGRGGRRTGRKGRRQEATAPPQAERQQRRRRRVGERRDRADGRRAVRRPAVRVTASGGAAGDARRLRRGAAPAHARRG